jgi:hypothetical protein
MTSSSNSQALDQPRSTQRLAARVPTGDEVAPLALLRDLARRVRAGAGGEQPWPQGGRLEGEPKRIHRLRIAEGLSVPYRLGRLQPTAAGNPTKIPRIRYLTSSR